MGLFFGIVAVSLLGIACGCVTGLVPGLHVNTVALLMLALYHETSFDPVMLACFIVAMGVTHSFVDFVPSVFLGVPDSSNVLALQPAHRMVIKGKGLDALALSVAGGFAGIVLLCIACVPMVFVVPVAYGAIRGVIPYLLVFAMLYMVAIERYLLWGFVVALLSSLYGVVLMNGRSLSGDNALFLMLTGLFGVSTLMVSFFTSSCFPSQRRGFSLGLYESFSGSVVGFFGGLFAGVMPGLGSSQSAILVQKVFRVNGVRKFIAALGCLNTIDIVVSVLALYLIGRARSGSAIVISEVIDVNIFHVALFIGVSLLAAGISAYLTLCFGVFFAENIGRVNYKLLVFSVIMFLMLMVFFYEGLWGVFVCLTGTFIGILPSLFGVKKSLLMSALVVPTAFYLFGAEWIVLGFLGL